VKPAITRPQPGQRFAGITKRSADPIQSLTTQARRAANSRAAAGHSVVERGAQGPAAQDRYGSTS
jgi:hypothetical protein